MLTSLPSVRSAPTPPSGKENSISESANNEGFSEHLGTKSAQASDPEKPESAEPDNHPTRSNGTSGGDRDVSSEDEPTSGAILESMPLEPQSEPLNPQKALNEMRFAQLVKSQELEITLPTADGELLMPSAEVESELLLANATSPTTNQNLISAVSQSPVVGAVLVKDSKLFKDKTAKPGSPLSANLQSSIAVKPITGAQNLMAQPDTAIQPNIAVSQERGASVDVDLEKAIGVLELKTPTPSVSVDSTPQKLSIETNVPSMSQPSQTLVRAIQENSNWTKVLATSSVQLDETQKIDGTVLQKLDIHLNLTALGKLDVKLRLQQGELQVQIRTDSEQAYKMLSVDQDVLANTIKGLGYKVDTIAISGPRTDGGFQMNSNSQSDGQQHSSEQHYQNEKSGQRSDREFMPMKDAENDTPIPSSVVEDSATNANVI